MLAYEIPFGSHVFLRRNGKEGKSQKEAKQITNRRNGIRCETFLTGQLPAYTRDVTIKLLHNSLRNVRFYFSVERQYCLIPSGSRGSSVSVVAKLQIWRAHDSGISNDMFTERAHFLIFL